MTDLFVTVFCAVLTGFGLEHIRIRYVQHRKRRGRRQFLGMPSRRDPEPSWARWSPEIGRAIGGRRDA